MVALVVGIASLCLLFGTGLTTDSPHGVGDNGDGARLYCGAGIVPDTPDKRANWKGVVIDTFRTGGKPCAHPMPSFALLPILLTTGFSGPIWNLRSLGWTWVGVLVLAFGIAAAAAGAAQARRALVVVPVALPLALPAFSRFLLSTFGEAAGLVGTAVTLAGVAATVAGPPRGIARWTALLLSIFGGVLAATAKPAFAVVLVPVLVLCVVMPPTRSRISGLVLALFVVLGATVPVTAAIAFQNEQYGTINTHNLVFTAVGPASGGDSLYRLGLPPDTARALGRAYYPDGGASVPDWDVVVGAQWARLRMGALGYVAAHPRTALRMIDGAFRAASDPRVSYLPADFRSDPDARPTPIPDSSLGEQGAYERTLEPWLNSRPLGRLPWVLIGAAAVAGATGTIRRRGRTSTSALSALWVCAAGTMGLLAIAAVMGDGFFEIAKHTWLAAYGGSVAISALVFCGAASLPRVLRKAPSAQRSSGTTGKSTQESWRWAPVTWRRSRSLAFLVLGVRRRMRQLGDHPRRDSGDHRVGRDI